MRSLAREMNYREEKYENRCVYHALTERRRSACFEARHGVAETNQKGAETERGMDRGNDGDREQLPYHNPTPNVGVERRTQAREARLWTSARTTGWAGFVP